MTQFIRLKGGVFSICDTFLINTPMANPMSKRWCFTINYSEENPWFPEVAWKPADMEYMVCQRELAPTTGQTHWQGYVRCATRKRMTTIKRLLNRENAHLEIAKGTEQQCKDYCTKIASRAVDDAEPFERGNFNPEEGSREGQGRRSDLEAAAAMIDSGASLLEVAQTHQSDFIRYHGGLMQYKALKDSAALKQPRDVRVEIWWGPGGHGKTHWARQAGGGQSVYSVEAILHPWDSYAGESTILLDEFKWESWPIDTMKRLMDKWPWELLRVLQQIRRVASCHNLAEQFPGYFVQRCDRPGPGGIPPPSSGFSTLTTV